MKQESFDFVIGNGIINPPITSTTPYGGLQESYDLGISSGNNTEKTAPVPSGGALTIVMPPITGQYTTLLFEVQQSSAGVSSSTKMQLDGPEMWNNRMNQS